MAVASVWNWNRLDYDYYQTPEKDDLGGWDTLSGLGVNAGNKKNGVGIGIEDALPKLPSGSKRIGRGTQAKGRIMRQGTALGAVRVPEPDKEINWMPFVFAGVLFLLWRETK